MTRSQVFAYAVTTVTAITYAAVILFINLDNLPETLPANVERTLFSIGYYSVLPFIALVIFYMAYAAVDGAVPSEKKWLWVWLIFFGHFFVIPFFWHRYVWYSNTFSRVSPSTQCRRGDAG